MTDLEGGRVPYPCKPPRWHAEGRLVCWGPKVSHRRRTRLAARLDALWRQAKA